MTPRAFAFYAERNPGIGLALVCGQISGNLEMLEIEGRASNVDSLEKIARAAEAKGVLHTWDWLQTQGYCELTPSGGMHLLYFLPADKPVPGNTKLAQNAARECLAETRGEGGYVVVAPTGGTVHKTGQPWTCVAGTIGDVPTLTWEARDLLHAAITEALDETPPPPPPAPVAPRLQGAGDRPGDAFNDQVSWAEILEPHGWTVSHTAGAETFWVRPDKDRRDGHSASTGYVAGADRLYVWSSSTVFDTEVPYSKFGAYALLNHAGNHANAARELGRRGFGEPLTPKAKATPVDFPALVITPQKSQVAARNRNTSVGNAERMVDGFGQQFRYLPAASEWRAWDGSRWRTDTGMGLLTQAVTAMTYGIEDEAREMLDADADSKEGKALLKWSETSQMDRGMNGTINQFARRSEVIAEPDEFDQATGYLNLPNGVYDLDQHVLLPHDRKYMATQVFGASYDPDATSPRFDKLMETLVPDPELRRFVQRAVGYSLLGRQDQRAMFIVHGPKRTGKSQFLNILSSLFGEYGDTAQAGSFHKMDKRGDAATPGLHALRNKRFVAASEESEHAVLDTEALKRLTGNEAVTTRALYQQGQRWRPQMTLWIATNPLPQLNSDDDAIWDRVKPIPFTTQFSARGGEGTLKETPGIAESIWDEEASGIFNWALAGLKEFQQLGGLDQPVQIEQGVADYRHATDPVSQFWHEAVDLGQLVADADATLDFKHLYQAYVNWCAASSERAINARRFSSRIKSLTGITAFTKSNSRYLVPGWSWRIVNGIFGSM